jgi:hypothetical protein
MQIEQDQTPDLTERIGIVIWKIAVLVIGLRGILALVPRQGVLDGLSIGSMVLQASALVLMTVGASWAVIRALRGTQLPGAAPRRRAVAHPLRDTDR